MLKYLKPIRKKLSVSVNKRNGRKIFSFAHKGKVFRYHRMDKCSEAPLEEIRNSGYDVFCPVYKILARRVGPSRREVRIQPFNFI